ncbi:hypothetical protein DFJ74DRAFT_707614 [Hyaloraphidium curvatum]|nr:hypothetical protein DFJ74DRAFT_707614 [Hyaloraphidium curvatum]
MSLAEPFIQPEYHLSSLATTSFYDPSVTYVWGRYSCVAGVYPFHVACAYAAMVAGIGCLLSRAGPLLKPAHAWFGKVYFVAMLWVCGTGIVIHNTGLPGPVIWSFVFVLGGMCLGWPFAIVHRALLRSRAAANVARRLAEQPDPFAAGAPDLDRLIAAEMVAIEGGKSWVARVFSLKSAHGALMVVSWGNMMGRIGVTNVAAPFSCFTYPFYKPFDVQYFNGTTQPLTPLPYEYPNPAVLPWTTLGVGGFLAALSVGFVLLSLLVAAVWVAADKAIANRRAARAKAEAMERKATETTAAQEMGARPAEEGAKE